MATPPSVRRSFSKRRLNELSNKRQQRFKASAAFKTNRPRRLDRWHEAKDVRFQFGYDAKKNLIQWAEDLDESAWQTPTRPARYAVQTKPRSKPNNVKRQVIRRRQFEHMELQSEQVAEFDDQPTACQRSYRMVVIRKNISHEKGDNVLFDEIRDFFSITNDRAPTTGTRPRPRSSSAATTAAIRRT